MQSFLKCLAAIQDAANVTEAVTVGMEYSGLMAHYAEEEERLEELRELQARSCLFPDGFS